MSFHGPSLRDAKYYAVTGSKVYFYTLDVAPEWFEALVGRSKTSRADFRAPSSGSASWSRDGLRLRQYHYQSQRGVHSGPRQEGEGAYGQALDQLYSHWVRRIDEKYNRNPTPSNGINMGFTWSELGSNNAVLSITENPAMAQVRQVSMDGFQGFNPRAFYWICNATAIDGVAPPYCSRQISRNRLAWRSGPGA